MDVEVLLDYLKNGELSNLPISNFSVIENKNKVFSFINRGLAELNREFQINQVENIIKLKPTVSRYFINDPKMVLLLAAYDNNGKELDINNEAKPTESIFTPSLGTIDWYGTNLSETEEDYISVVYLKGFPNVSSGTTNINVSEGLLEALANYVGYCANIAVDSGERQPADKHYQRYMNSLMMAKNSGIGADTNSFVTNKFSNRGFT